MKKKLLSTLLVFIILFSQISYAETLYNENSVDIQAVETEQIEKYPDYAEMYTGVDKHEKFNRKMFNLNMKLNKFIAKPVHIIWASIMPKFGMDRIRDAYNNIEYPKRLASCIIQRDGKGIKQETLRFLTNTTLGIGGLFDPADKIFKVKPTNENMEQALCKCKIGSGAYLVMPGINSCTPRSLCGRALEAALDPCVYLASPVISIVKFGLMLNRTSYMQPLANLIETTYADPYDIHKKLFGIENYIRNSNFDREELLREEKQLVEEGHPELAEKLIADLGENKNNNNEIHELLPLTSAIKPDIFLEGYKIQTPVIDSMKTAFFEDKSVNKSIWNELSVWNRSFAKRIKTDSVSINNGVPYKYKYILQKDKNAPIIFIYPSIGEGAGNHHSIIFAKLFYDEGYSVIMQGSHFHWEFVKSMPENFAPGIPTKDSELVQLVSSKILDKLSSKYELEPKEKVIFGTSFGAVTTLFVADIESKNQVLNIDKYIAVSPPIELKYALTQLDKNSNEFDKNSSEVKNKTALTAAKILQLYDLKDEKNFKSDTLPFTDEEGKLITTFILRQKLSDLIFTLEKVPKNKESEVYKMINNMSYQDYAEKYLGVNINDENCEILNNSSLFAISDFLSNNDNYKIYHSLDDYFINTEQISKLKKITGSHLVCLNCGAHLGFLNRKEFLDDLKKTISKS